MKKILILLSIALSLLIMFVIFTLIVRTDTLRGFDFNVTVKIQDRLPERIYTIFSLVTRAGGFFITGGILLTLLIIFKKSLIMFMTYYASYIGMHILEAIGKITLYQPKPHYMFYKLPTAAWFPDSYQPEGNAFPSGHAMRFAFLGVFLIFALHKDTRIHKFLFWIFCAGILTTTFLMGFGKIALGQHWATDVIAGWLLGVSMGFAAIAAENIIKHFFLHKKQPHTL